MPAGESAAIKAAVEFLYVLNAAVTNIRLYPPTSAIIRTSVERLHNTLQKALSVVPYLEFAESERTLLVLGEPLPEKEQQRPQIRSFLELMLDFGIKTITIEKGVSVREISAFLQLFAKTPGEVDVQGGISAYLKGCGVEHIRIDEKIYVEVDSEHTITPGMGLSDEEIARILLGNGPVTEETIDRVREMAQDPEWLGRILQQGVQRVLEEAGGTAKTEFSKTFMEMLSTLDGFSEYDKEELARYIVTSMADMDDATLAAVLAQNLDVVFGEDFIRNFAKELSPERFARLFSRIREMVEASGESGFSEEEKAAINKMYDLLKETPQGRSILEENPAQGDAGKIGKQEMDPIERAKVLKDAVNKLVSGDTAPLFDSVVVESLPATVVNLASRGKNKSADIIIEKLSEALIDPDPEVRKAGARILAAMEEGFTSTGLDDKQVEVAKKLADWIKFESAISSEYEHITQTLEKTARDLIRKDKKGDAADILDAYHMITMGNLSKDEAIQALALNMLQNISTEDILDLLLKEQGKRSPEKTKDDLRCLVILGTTAVERLLDRLLESHSMSERNRIIQALTQVGKPVLGPVKERLRQGGPWYYIRNLVMLLGRIGDESVLPDAANCLGHKDYRVQREAVKAIQALDGKEACRILCDALGNIDSRIMDYVVTVLGVMGCKEAVPMLIEMLESRTYGRTKEEREKIQEKICEALGRMQYRPAIPNLEKIVRSKGFFGLARYPERIRTAAAKALSQIKKAAAAG